MQLRSRRRAKSGLGFRSPFLLPPSGLLWRRWLLSGRRPARDVDCNRFIMPLFGLPRLPNQRMCWAPPLLFLRRGELLSRLCVLGQPPLFELEPERLDKSDAQLSDNFFRFLVRLHIDARVDNRRGNSSAYIMLLCGTSAALS